MPFPDLKKITLTIDEATKQALVSVADYIKSVLTSDSVEDKKEVADDLSEFPHTKLLKLVQENSDIENFLRTDSYFNELLKAKLQAAGQISIPLQSMDKQNTYGLLDLYLGASFERVAIHEKAGRVEALNQAIYLGLNDAFLVRYQAKYLEISRSQDAHKIDSVVGVILQELGALTNSYWSMGYAQAAVRFYALGEFFKSKGEVDRGAMFTAEAAKCIAAGSKVSTYSEAQEIEKNMGGPAKIFDPFLKSIGRSDLTFKDWTNMEIIAQQLVGKDVYKMATGAAEKEVNMRFNADKSPSHAAASLYGRAKSSTPQAAAASSAPSHQPK